MSPEPPPTADRVAQLRDAFDSAFASAPVRAADSTEDLLAIEVGGIPCALRLAEVAGIHARRPVTALPGAPGAILGLTSLRGGVIAIYDLYTLLGGTGGGEHRWFALTSDDPAVGLAFDQFEGHLRVPRDAIAEDAATRAPAHMREAVNLPSARRPIVQISTLLDIIKTPRGPAHKE